LKKINEYIDKKLADRLEQSMLRELVVNDDLIDFCSNDYLGFGRSDQLKALINSELQQHSHYFSGSTGSRLISGNSTSVEELESDIAAFHHTETALVFNSGYDANVGLFSALPQRGDTIILDELIHASIIDGARLSYANRYSFKHNNLESLEEKLKIARGNIYIGIESIYSMDGDAAPLRDMVALANRYDAALIVDEAHASGIFGKQGRGLIDEFGLDNHVFARVITFGKALGCHGAAVLGNKSLKTFLINFARSFIYTTAASHFTHLSIKMAYQLLAKTELSIIHHKIKLFRDQNRGLADHFIDSVSPIQSLVVPGNSIAKDLAGTLQDKGFYVRAILHPTVPKGKERLRICLHAFNSDEDIINLSKAIREHL
jgi:8-amino-7-oxononanoate synthase